MRKMEEIRERRGKKIPYFLSRKDSVSDTDVQIAYQSLWIAFLLFTSSSPPAQFLSSLHSPLTLSFFFCSSLLSPSVSLPLHLCILLLSSPFTSLLFLNVYPFNFLSFSLFQSSNRPIQEVCVCVCLHTARLLLCL